MSKKANNLYSKEFRVEAVKMVIEGGISPVDIVAFSFLLETNGIPHCVSDFRNAVIRRQLLY